MNYYDETVIRIEDLIRDGRYEDAKRLILNELDLPYVPKDFEEKMKELLSDLKDHEYHASAISIDQIEDFLNSDDQHQLIAVQQLDRLNLREHIGMCESFLKSTGLLNAKVLLIDSLIRQQIDHHFVFKDKDREIIFDPAELEPVTESDGYKRALECLQELFMKEPSMLRLSEQLLYKEAMMALPLNLDQEDGDFLADKIEKYIRRAFEQGTAK